MHKENINNIIKELVERISGDSGTISPAEENYGNLWFSVEIGEPHLFTSRDGEGLQALNHLVHRIIEASAAKEGRETELPAVLVDIGGFQKKRIENIRAIAHMMSERARYFKSNIEIDPMTAFERRIVHEFLSGAEDLETESVGTGRSRRVVIKYVGNIK